MMYRLLGGISLAIGGIFALVTILVLLPFLNNFNTSLLVLAAIFGVFAWVFLAIGWQLLHPPRPKGRPSVSQATEEEPEPGEEPVQASALRSSPNEGSSQETKDPREHHLRAPHTL